MYCDEYSQVTVELVPSYQLELEQDLISDLKMPLENSSVQEISMDLQET